MGENVPSKPVFRVQVRRCSGFKGKNLKTVFGTLFPPKKGYIHFCRPAPAPSKIVMPPKIIFAVILENIVVFFSKKLLNEKYSKLQCLQKKVTLILVVRHPIHSKRSCPPTNVFFTVLSENIAFFEKLVL